MVLQDLFATPAVERLGSEDYNYVPDDASNACLRCKTAFTLFFRRHHCRACGALVCWDCLVRVKMGDGAVAVSRICGDCEKKPAAKLILAAFEQQNEGEAGGSPQSSEGSRLTRSGSWEKMPKAEFNKAAPHLDAQLQSTTRQGKGLTRLPSIPEELRSLTRLPSIPELRALHHHDDDEEEEEEEDIVLSSDGAGEGGLFMDDDYDDCTFVSPATGHGRLQGHGRGTAGTGGHHKTAQQPTAAQRAASAPPASSALHVLSLLAVPVLSMLLLLSVTHHDDVLEVLRSTGRLPLRLLRQVEAFVTSALWGRAAAAAWMFSASS